MPAPALTAEEVGQIIVYVAPGFFARAGYRARFPGPAAPAADILIVSVALSLPFVAFADAITGGTTRPTELSYVMVLLGSAVLAGYLFALARANSSTRKLLGKLGLRYQPDGTMWALTLMRLEPDERITIERSDGSGLQGDVRAGPMAEGDGFHELMLSHVAWRNTDGTWTSPRDEHVVIPLREIRSITLPRDPTADLGGRRAA